MTLSLDRVILHTIVHHSSTSTYMSNFIEIEETFCGRTDGRTFETHFIRSTQKTRPKKLISTASVGKVSPDDLFIYLIFIYLFNLQDVSVQCKISRRFRLQLRVDA